MTDQELKIRLLGVISQRLGVLAVREVLVDFASKGGTRARANTVLNEMLVEAPDEATDDAVRDALDVSTGWCSPRLRVWPGVSDER